MSGTGSKKVNIVNAGPLGSEDIRDRLLGYSVDKSEATLRRIFPGDGAFDALIDVQPAAGDCQIDIAPSVDSSGTDGLGHEFFIEADDPYFQGINIPPEDGIDFYVGLEFALVPDPHSDDSETPVTTAKDGQMFYKNLVEGIGKLATPTEVTDNEDGTITINVNSLFLSGEDHSGRKVRVWLVAPKTAAKAGSFPATTDVCIDECVVTYDAPNNLIELPHTLGQGSDVSEVETDYQVLLLGPTVSKTNLFAEDGVLGLAVVTAVDEGAIPGGNIDIGQQDLSTFDIARLSDITRTGTNGDLKVSVTAHASDLDTESQIEVLDQSAAVSFKVTSNGDVYIAGDLQVDGSETITDTQIVLGDVQIGDAATDDLLIYSQTTIQPGAGVTFGDGSQAVPDGFIKWNGSTQDVTIDIPASGVLAISRNDGGAATQMKLEQRGAGGKVGLAMDGDLTLNNAGATSPTATLSSSTASWGVQNASGELDVTVNNASERFVDISNAGAGEASLKVEGRLQLQGTGTNAGLIETIGASIPLRFDDANLSAPVPLTQSGDTGLVAGNSIIRNINDLQTGQSNIRQNGVVDLNGLVTSAAAGLSVDVTAGSVVINGITKTFTGTTNVSGLTNNTTNYIYVTAAGAIASTITKATAFSLSTLPLAVVVTSGGAVSSVTNIRSGVPRLNQNGRITVGDSNNPNAYGDFNTLIEALDWVKHWHSVLSSTHRPEVEIVLVGEIDLRAATQYVLSAEHAGIVIRGARVGDGTNGRTRIRWGGSTNTYLFRFDTAAARIRFEDLAINFENSGSTRVNYVFDFADSGGSSTAPDAIAVRRCRFTLSNTNDTGAAILRVPTTSGSGKRLTFEDNVIDYTGGGVHTLFDIGNGSNTGYRLFFRNNTCMRPLNNSGASNYDRIGGTEGSVVSGNEFVGGQGLTFTMLIVGGGKFSENTFRDMPRGIELRNFDGLFSNNELYEVGSSSGGSASSGHGIEVTGNSVVTVSGNIVEMVSGALGAGIAITQGTAGTTQVTGGGNIVRGGAASCVSITSGVTSANFSGTVCRVTNATPAAVQIAANGCAFTGGAIKAEGATASTGVAISGNDNVVVGNAIKATTDTSDSGTGNVIANNAS